MKKLIAIALLAGLTACTTKTDSPAETKPETPAAEPAKSAEATPPPAESKPAEEPAKAPDAAKPADAKPADKPAPPPLANKGRILARFQTSMGNFTAELNDKEAPITVENFVGLASGTKEWTDPRTGAKQKKPYYDGLIFHRIIAGFMIQGGDPLGNGTGGPGYGIKDEFNNLKHDSAGVLAMARTGMPDSAGSQFYITLGPQPRLDERSIAPDGRQVPYVVFGRITEGLDNVMKIGVVSTAPGDRPLTPVVINKITIERAK